MDRRLPKPGGSGSMRETALKERPLRLLTFGLDRSVRFLVDSVTAEAGKTQANVFRGANVSRFEEHDFCFAA